jgi:hypothetical protein
MRRCLLISISAVPLISLGLPLKMAPTGLGAIRAEIHRVAEPFVGLDRRATA